MAETADYRYEQVADFVTRLIDAGTLLPGARAPSLRQIARQRRTSVTTALHAYRLLEDRGILEARPQSGFYVARSSTTSLDLPPVSSPSGEPTQVTVSDLIGQLLELAADPRFLPLGCAIPSAELLAAGGLDRFLARAARLRGTELNTYLPPNGDLRLRQEIARRAMRWGQAVAPEDIVITCGCTEALVLALKSVTGPGDTVAIESPTYFGLLQVIEGLGLKALELPTDPAGGIDLARLEAALAQGTVQACLFASSISNPLGSTLPEGRKQAILDFLYAHDIPLIEDDIYGDIYFGAERPRPFAALDGQGITLYCSSFSKTLAPGYRIGWISTTRHKERIRQNKIALTLSSPGLPQAALADFLASGGYDNHLRRLRRTFKHNVDLMLRTIDRSFPAGTRVSRPTGGFVVWVQLPGAVDARTLLDRALEVGICFAPGDAFSAANRFRNCLRLSCGYDWDDRMEQGVVKLGQLAGDLLGPG